MTDAKEARIRAHQAARELRETEGAFADVRAALIDRLLGTGPEQSATREACYHAIVGLDAARAILGQVIEGGLIEEAIDEQLRRQKPKVNDA